MTDMTTVEGFGDRVRRLRKAKKMTQSELAERAGYTSKAAISKIEKGINGVPLKYIDKLARALGTTSDYLLGLPDLKEEQVSTQSRITPVEGFSNFSASTFNPGVDFALIAPDNSMEKSGINAGDIVTVKKTQDVEIGDLVVLLEDRKPVIRRYFGEDVRDILGKAVSVEKSLS